MVTAAQHAVLEHELPAPLLPAEEMSAAQMSPSLASCIAFLHRRAISREHTVLAGESQSMRIAGG